MRDLPALVVSPVRGFRSWCATAGPGGAAGAAGTGRGGAEPLRDGRRGVLVVLGRGAAVSGMTWFPLADGEGAAASAAGRDAGGEGEAALTDAHQGRR
jgi:hypothetical protein